MSDKSALPAALLFLALPAGIAAAASIDEQELALAYGDRTLVSIATGSPQPLRRAPSVATVITADDIAASGATDLDEALLLVPGLHTTRSAVDYAPQYLVRGVAGGSVTNPQVLMLRNGVPMTLAYNGDRGNPWGGLPLENVARIEVIRGPGSALYGANAFAGVINIITKNAAQIAGTEAGVRAGSFKTRDAWLLHGGTLGPVELVGWLRVGETEGQRRIIEADNQTRLDRLFGTHASLAPGPVSVGRDAVDAALELSRGAWRWRADYRLRNHLGTGAGVSQALDPVSAGRGEWFNTDLSWTEAHVAPGWSAGASAAFQRFNDINPRIVLFPPGARFPTGVFPDGVIGGPNRYERTLRLSAYAVHSGLAEQQWRIGAGHDDIDLYRTETWKNYLLNAGGVPVPTGPQIEYSAIQPHLLPHRRRVDYVYAQHEWTFAPDWTLTSGVRHDRYSDAGGTTHPRLALVWDASRTLTAKLLYGSAFRAPAFNEAYGVNPVASGNGELRPETIRTWEAALKWQASPATQLNLNLFRHTLRDLIRTVPNPPPAPGATWQNTGTQRGHGGELEAAWDAGGPLRLSGHYAWQRNTDGSSGRDAGYAPRHRLFVRADWRAHDRWRLGAELNHVAGRQRAAGDARPPVADYTTLDVVLRSQRGSHEWNVAAGVRNLFDADVREPSLAPGVIPNDLPQAPRALWLQLTRGF